MYPALSCAPFGVETPVSELLSLAMHNGFTSVQISRAQMLELNRLGLQHSKNLINENNVSIVSFFIPVEWRKDEALFQRDMQVFSSIAALAAQLGVLCGCTWVHPNYATPPEQSRQWIGERFQAIDRILGENGIRFGIEPCGASHFLREPGHTFIYGFEQALSFAEELGQNAGLVVDSFHWHCMDDMENYLPKIPRERIVDAHIADAPDRPREDQRDNERELPGLGIIDLRDFLQVLSKTGYSGPVGIESFGPALQNMNPDQIATKAIQCWQKLMEQASLG